MIAIVLPPFRDVRGGDGFAGGGDFQLDDRAGFNDWSSHGCLNDQSSRGRGGNFTGDAGDQGADGNFLAFADEDFKNAICCGFELVRNLVGFEGNEDVALFNGIAVFLVPAGDVGGGDGFASGRNFDVE